MVRVSIVMPAHNEERRIGNTLKEYSSFFERLREENRLSYEILVVINNTRDRTEEVVKDAQRSNKNIRYLNLKPGGKGFAVIEGFKDALKRENALIGFVDADNATSAEEYWKLINAVDGCDGIIADRYLGGSIIMPKPTWARLFARRLFNFWARVFLMIPFGDTQCGAKVFRREVIQEVLPMLSMSQWAFDVELLYVINKQGYSIAIHPTKWVDKEYSTINFWQSGPWMALAILRLRLVHSPFRDFVRFYDKIMNLMRGKKWF